MLNCIYVYLKCFIFIIVISYYGIIFICIALWLVMANFRSKYKKNIRKSEKAGSSFLFVRVSSEPLTDSESIYIQRRMKKQDEEKCDKHRWSKV